MNLSEGIKKALVDNPLAFNDEVLLRALLYDYCGNNEKAIEGVKIFIKLNNDFSIIEDIKNNKDKNVNFYKSKAYKFKKISLKQYEFFIDEIFEGFGYTIKKVPQILPNIIPTRKNKKAKINKTNANNSTIKPQPLKVFNSLKFSKKITGLLAWILTMGVLVCANEFGVLYGLKHIKYNSNLNVGLSILSTIMMLILSFVIIAFAIQFYCLDIRDYYNNQGKPVYKTLHLPLLFGTYFCIRMVIFLCENKAIYNKYYVPLLVLTIVYAAIILIFGFVRFNLELKIKENHLYYFFTTSSNLMMIISLVLIITLTSLMTVWVCYVICFGTIAILLGLIYYEVIDDKW